MVKNVFRFIGKSPTWVLGFTHDGPDLVWAVIKNTAEGPVLDAYGRSASSDEAFSKVQGVPKDNIYVASVFPSVQTLCRSLVLPKLKQKEVRAALLDTLDQTTSLRVDESVLAYESDQAKDGSWAVVSYVTQQKQLEAYLETAKSKQIEPEYVIPKAACFAAFIAHFSLTNWQFIIDIGGEETTLVLAYEGRVVESTSLIGGKSILESIETASASKESPLYQLLQHFREIITAYKGRYELPDSTPLTITGGLTSSLAIQAIKEAIGAPLSPLHTTSGQVDTSFLKSASAVGAAFLAEPNQQKGDFPNFRSDTFAFAQPFLHWTKPLIALCAFSLLLSFSFIWLGNNRAASITNAMNKEWNKITEEAHTTSEAVLKAAEREGTLFDPNEATSPVELVRQGDWFFSDLEKKALFPLHPDIPRFSELLIWLNTQIKEAESAEGADTIYLDSIHYVLSSRPTKSHPKEKYQVRIDLEVTTSSAVGARALHNRLLAQNQFVDPSTDVKWSGNNNKYRASFVLRDKTIYPTKEP
jgi:hypothetical protein